jgi:hypothetical protein
VPLRGLRHLDVTTHIIWWAVYRCPPVTCTRTRFGQFPEHQPRSDVASTPQAVSKEPSQTHVWALNSPIFLHKMPAEQRRRYKFTASFDQVFRSEDVEVICCPIGRLGRAFAEWWVGTARCSIIS